VLGELGLVTAVGTDSDAGVPFVLGPANGPEVVEAEKVAHLEWRTTMASVADKVWRALH